MITQKQLLCLLILSLTMNTFGFSKSLPFIAGQRDTWIGIIASALPALLWAYMLLRIRNNVSDNQIYTWIKHQAGSLIAFLCTSIIGLFLLISLYIGLTDVAHWIHVWFLPYTHYYIIVLMLSTAVAIGTLLGIRTLAIASGLLLPLLLLLFITLLLGLFKNLHPSELLPITENGWMPVHRAMLSTLIGMTDWILLFLLAPHSQGKMSYRTVYAMLVIQVIALAIPNIMSLSAFGLTEALQQRYPALGLWRLAGFGEHFSHIDSLSIPYFGAVALIRFSLLLFCFSRLFKMKRVNQTHWLIILTCLGAAVLSCLTSDNIQFTAFIVRWNDIAIGSSIALLATTLFLFTYRAKKETPIDAKQR